MANSRFELGGLTPQAFLDKHWQKQPLLVRGAVPGIGAPLATDALFALACEPRIISRLIVAPRGDANWNLRRGPFEARDFEVLPPDGWTLLIQEADRHVAACASLLERFRFVPNWRVDDVMLSYATDGGGVGPHLDRYDVFLIQAQGRRRWRIGGEPLEDARLEPGVELPVLAEFEYDQEWLLEPGDALYLPPGIAHEGVAVGECVTCSVGFRVPDPRELCSGFLRQLAPSVFEAIRYSDPELCIPEHLGEIPAVARDRLRESAQRLFEGEGFDRWVGRFLTRPLRGTQSPADASGETVARMRDRLERGEVLWRSAPSHYAWYRKDDGIVYLFVGGEGYSLGTGREKDAELLCGLAILDEVALRPLLRMQGLAEILADLVLRGFLSWSPRPRAKVE
jgi:50S ribosomal protein L16 3-hydroxylase